MNGYETSIPMCGAWLIAYLGFAGAADVVLQSSKSYQLLLLPPPLPSTLHHKQKPNTRSVRWLTLVYQ